MVGVVDVIFEMSGRFMPTTLVQKNPAPAPSWERLYLNRFPTKRSTPRQRPWPDREPLKWLSLSNDLWQVHANCFLEGGFGQVFKK
jgi:hypothetical protein